MHRGGGGSGGEDSCSSQHFLPVVFFPLSIAKSILGYTSASLLVFITIIIISLLLEIAQCP